MQVVQGMEMQIFFFAFKLLLLNKILFWPWIPLGTCSQMWNCLICLLDWLCLQGCHYQLTVSRFLSTFVILLRAVSTQANNIISVSPVRCQCARNVFLSVFLTCQQDQGSNESSCLFFRKGHKGKAEVVVGWFVFCRFCLVLLSSLTE